MRFMIWGFRVSVVAVVTSFAYAFYIYVMVAVGNISYSAVLVPAPILLASLIAAWATSHLLQDKRRDFSREKSSKRRRQCH